MIHWRRSSFAPARPRLRVRAVVAPAAALLLAGCDPCFGTVGCGQSWVAYQGRIHEVGASWGLQDVRVTFHPAGSLGDSVVMFTDAHGRFDLRVDSPHPVVGDFRIAAEGRIPHVVRNVELAPLRRGNVRPLPPWTVEPFLVDHVSIYFRGNGRPAAGAEATFHRLGGVEAEPQSFSVVTSEHGSLWLHLHPAAQGAVAGRWDVRVPGVEESFPSLVHEYPTDHQLGRVWHYLHGIGPSLAYRGRVAGADGAPLAGVEVRFTRTAGLALEDDAWTTSSDEDGEFAFRGRLSDPLIAGEVTGTLSFHPPGEWESLEVPELVLPTFDDSDEPKMFGEWRLSRRLTGW